MPFMMFLLAAAAAQAAPATTTSDAQAAAKKSDADRVICQKVEETGSRLGAKKVCMTKLQ